MKHLLLLLALSTTVHAHHGQDFFVTLDTRVPDLGGFSTFVASSWSKQSGSDETAVEPGFLAGLGNGFAFGTSVQMSNDTPGSWGYAGVTPLIQWSAAIPDTPLRFGFSAAYHFADSSHVVAHDTAHVHVTPDPSGPGSNPDAPPPGQTQVHFHNHGGHHHGGIHRHGEDHFEIRFLGEWQATAATRLVFNMITVGSASDDIALGYSAGVRHELTERFAVGLETFGDFNTHGEHEAIAGLYFSPRHDLTLRLGTGVGIGPSSPDFALHSGVTWRF